MIAIKEEDTGRTISVKVSEPFAVQLEENPTTGYVWEIEECGDALELMESSFERPQYVSDGAGGKRIFKFIASKEGDNRLKFKLYREWEGQGSIVKRCVFSLKVCT